MSAYMVEIIDESMGDTENVVECIQVPTFADAKALIASMTHEYCHTMRHVAGVEELTVTTTANANPISTYMVAIEYIIDTDWSACWVLTATPSFKSNDN